MTTHFTKTDLDFLQFGGGFAEIERRQGWLIDHFLPTPVFDALRKGQVDLVLGEKGVGKSTLFGILAERTEWTDQMERSGIHVVPAFDVKTQMAALFGGDQVAEADASQTRLLWRAFALAAIGNHIVDTFEGDDVDGLAESLDVLDLRPKDKRERRNLFKKAISAMLGADRSSDLPRKPTLDSAQPTAISNLDDLIDVLDETDELLAAQGREVWLIFDRLDEAFFENIELETKALRSLLQTVQDLNSQLDHIKLIALCRSDVFDRVVLAQDGQKVFVNQTHFASKRIEWDANLLVRLIAKRCMASDLLRKIGITPPAGDTESVAYTILENLLPARDPEVLPPLAHDEHFGTLAWILEATAHRSGSFNPRNVVDLFEIAKEEEQSRWRSRPTSTRSLLSDRSIRSAWRKLSAKRLTDTVHAEFPSTAKLTNMLKGADYCYRDSAALSDALGLSADSDEFRQALALLQASGIVSGIARPGYEFQITALYRPIMEIAPCR